LASSHSEENFLKVGLLTKEQYNIFNNKQHQLTQGQGISLNQGLIGNIGSGIFNQIISATDADLENKGIILLAGDLTGTADLPRVNTVGGVPSSTITTIASSVLSATAINTADRIVLRDGSGGFAAGTITAGTLSSTTTNAEILTAGTTTLGNTTVGGTLTATTINAGSLTTGTLKVTGGTLAQGSVLTSDANGNATWGSNGLYSLNGQGATTHTFVTANTASSDFSITSALGTGTLSTTAIHTFNLPDAGVSTRGVVTTAAQTFAGNKIFSGTLSTTSLTVTSGLTAGAVTYPIAHGSSGQVLSTTGSGTLTWTSGLTGVDPIGSSPTTNGASISAGKLVLQPADGTNGGVLTSGTQTIGGQKSFANAVTNSGASNAGSSRTNIDFSLSNLAYTTAVPGAFSFINMKDGGTYTLAVQGTTSGISTFSGKNPSGSDFTFIPMGGNAATISGKQTLYTFMVMGTTVYYSMAVATN
jgi:hypothetical protein